MALRIRIKRKIGADRRSHLSAKWRAAVGEDGHYSFAAGELFKMMTGINMVHVPYRGSAPMLVDLLSGQVQIAFDILATSLPFIRSGALRVLAAAGRDRFEGKVVNFLGLKLD
jgi:tripartite-type tricarboxylate transporter receptor subunit TctC